MLPIALCALALTPDTPRIEATGNWSVKVAAGSHRSGRRSYRVERETVVAISPPSEVVVSDERHDLLPVFQPNAAPWAKGAKLKKLVTFETTSPDALDERSFTVKPAPGDAEPLRRGTDYELEARWATFGRLVGGRISEEAPVWVNYRCRWHRIDSVVWKRGGKVSVRQGQPHPATPHQPLLDTEEVRLANVWVPGYAREITQENLYPAEEASFVPERKRTGPAAKSLLPKTWQKLESGQPVHILAWGDSVTAGGEASDEAHRYQNRFVSLLRAMYPRSPVRLTTAAWGGRNSDSFRNEPPGSPYHFPMAVLAPKPDLVIMEFVNDTGFTREVLFKKYGELRDIFKEAGIEWVLITPHYVRADWMGAKSDRVEEDPREYVRALREFARENHLAVADASLRWGSLAKQGIPYPTLLSNSINHPDDRGHEIFAQALIDLFR